MQNVEKKNVSIYISTTPSIKKECQLFAQLILRRVLQGGKTENKTPNISLSKTSGREIIGRG